MIKITDGGLQDIWGVNAQMEPEIKAISYALQNAVSDLRATLQTSLVYAAMDDLNEKALDNLAAELGTLYYDQDLEIEVRRGLVKNTLKWYEKAGTPAAVEELMTVLFGGGFVTEWFDFAEPEGNEGLFDVNSSGELTPGVVAQLNTILRKVKNLRSHLRKVEISRRAFNNLYIATANMPMIRFSIRDGGLNNA